MSLEEKLEEAMRVSFDRMDTTVLHPRYSAYKTRIRNESPQEERRKATLEHQKQSRASLINGHRLGLPTSAAELKKLEKQLRKQEQHEAREKTAQGYDGSGKLIYKGVLMLSEWMVDVPVDLENAWIIRACPEGKRTLVVANRGWTRAFGRNGREIAKFPSRLPGGAFTSKAASASSSSSSSSFTTALTVLDCIFVRQSNAFYILDVVYWGCDIANCEAEFRFFWLNSKIDDFKVIEEEDQVSSAAAETEQEDKMEDDSGAGATVKKTWKYKFRRVKTLSYRDLVDGLPYPLYTAGGGDSNPLRLDGLLFFHKEGLYTWRGPKTPLVVWLKPFMVADILGFPVDPAYILEKPPVYNSLKMDYAEDVKTGEDGSDSAKMTT